MRQQSKKNHENKEIKQSFCSPKYQVLPLLMAFAYTIPFLNTLLNFHIAGSFSSFMSRIECHFLRDKFLSDPMQNSGFRNERPVYAYKCMYINIMYVKFHLVLRGGLNS